MPDQLEEKKRYQFKKEDKLKSRKAIEELFARGKSFTVFPLRVVWQVADKEQGLRAGVSAGSRYFKKAVDRNRAKRLMREAYRISRYELALLLKEKNKGMSVFFLYQHKELPEYHALKEKMEAAIKRLINLCHEKPEIHP